MSPTAKALLNRSQVYASEYGDQLSNHLPMAIISLDVMGAGDSDLTSFYDFYSRRLEKLSPNQTVIDEQNWRTTLGKHRHNYGYHQFFSRQIETLGVEGTLNKYLHELLPGVAGGAFHPLIRLAYAIECQSHWEVAEALASWCMAYLPLGPLPKKDQGPPVGPIESLRSLRADYRINPVSIPPGNVFSELSHAAASVVFTNHFARLNLSQVSLEKIADAVIRVYLASNDNFTALHCVTSTHAFRVIGKYINDPFAIRFLWQGISAAYLSIRCPSFDDFVQSSKGELPTWNEIRSIATKSRDDHVIKIVHTAWCENRTYGSSLYQEAAAKKVKLLS